MVFPPPDANNIVDLMPDHLSAINQKGMKQFKTFSPLYDLVMKYYIRPRIHKADPERHLGLWKELVGSVQGARILDLACGTGGLIECLHQNNDYTGLDLSCAMLKRAARRAGKKGFSKYRLVLADAEQQVFPAGSFELIVTDTALHMISDWQAALAAAARSLSSDGRIFCAVPVLGIDEKFDKGWGKYSQRPNFHALTRSKLQKACLDTGLSLAVQNTNGGMLYFTASKNKDCE